MTSLSFRLSENFLFKNLAEPEEGEQRNIQENVIVFLKRKFERVFTLEYRQDLHRKEFFPARACS